MSSTKCQFTYTWTIKNYSLCALKYGEQLKSPEFKAENLGFKGYLIIYPKGEKFVEYVSCYLFFTEFVQGQDDDRSIEFEIEMNDATGKTLVSQKAQIPFKTAKSWGWNKFTEIEQLENKNTCPKETMIVRCRLTTNNKLNKLSATGCAAQTKIGCKSISVKWNVRYSESLDWSESQTFSFPGSSPIKISITAPEDDLNINISMIKKKKDVPSCIHCTISMLDVKGGAQYVSSGSHIFVFADDVWNFPNQLKRSELNAKKIDFLRNDSFNLKCQVLFSNGIEFEGIQKYEYDSQCILDTPLEMNTISVLLTDLKNMHIGKKHTNVELRTGKNTIAAHKCILSARSPVFSAMFDQEMLETRSGVVDITDIDTDTLNLFIEFLYTGSLDEMDYESASKLLVAADKYQVNSLAEKCFSFIISILNHANVCDVLVLADRVGHTLLKEEAIDYIKAHKNEIFPSKEWLNCIQNNVELVTETLCKISEI